MTSVKNNAQTHIDTENRFGAHCYRSVPIVLERGEGVYLWDVQGKRYLDGMSAYSAVSLGHAHPRIMDALTQQASKLSMVSRAYHSDQHGPALQAMSKFFGFERALFMNSGVEAVDTAIKIARRWGYVKKNIAAERAEIIVMDGNFHGRSLTLISLSNNPLYRENFGPFVPGFKSVPFGDADALQKAITPQTCAVLVEPIQGEAGVVIPPADWLRDVRAICNANNMLLLADEVQSGLGRCGKRLASQDVRADVVMLGKSLGGGVLPVSAVLADSHIMDVLTPGSHGSTFGGNPLACRMVREVLSVVEDEALCEKSAILGTQWLETLRSLSLANVSDIRGMGLWVAIEIDANIANASQWTQQKVKEMADHGLLVKETRRRILRLAPPLIITPSQLDEATTIIKKVFV